MDYKKRAAAATLAVTMALTGGSIMTGCSNQNSIQTNRTIEEEKDENNYNHHSTPFIYSSSSSGINPNTSNLGSTSNSKITEPSGWQKWTTPSTGKISSSSYSGVRSGSVGA